MTKIAPAISEAEVRDWLDKEFIPKVERKARQGNKALWLLETTGSSDAAHLKAELGAELRLLYSDTATYSRLAAWDSDPSIKDPIIKRQLNVLLREFKQNMIPKALLEEIVRKEASLTQIYATFRPKLNGETLSENAILEVLTKETDPTKRQRMWEASKDVGVAMAPHILELVALRNQAARSVGYSDYFQMQLELQEVDADRLQRALDDLSARSDAAYSGVLAEIEAHQCQRFGVTRDQLGPWAWGEPFGQEDPQRSNLDALVAGVDIAQLSQMFYKRMGIDVQGVFERSDMLERPGKNQHAFCLDIDRSGDVRMLNNVKSSIKWLETVLHELGHAIYFLGIDPNLPWLLREHPHTLTTEAMALLAGRQAYRYDSLLELVGKSSDKDALMRSADASERRRQLIFSRWVLVMTAFESALYRDPSQDLNQLWWSTVERYQKIRPPKGRDGKCDWAAKIHIGLAPVYYFSYLLGELFASSIEATLMRVNGSRTLTSPAAGEFLQSTLFAPGNRMGWSALVKNVTGKPLTADDWIRQFAS